MGFNYNIIYMCVCVSYIALFQVQYIKYSSQEANITQGKVECYMGFETMPECYILCIAQHNALTALKN